MTGRFKNRVYNFNAGPATVAEEVLEQAKQEFLNYNGMGVSVMEISHRSPEFIAVAKQAEADLRELMQIPSNYHVLFLHGGAQGQFAAVPMNLLPANQAADYVSTGMWSEIAINTAKQYGNVHLVASSETQHYTTIPDQAEWQLHSDAAYLHYCDNETVNGVEFDYVPEVGDVPLVCDMSSSILSKPVDVNQFELIYAGAQKNIGPAGLAIVIVREDLVGHAQPITPPIWNYQAQADADSMKNTPPTFIWYMAGLSFQWLKRQGGVAKIAEINQRKATKLYTFIEEHSHFYVNKIEPRYRSTMNVVFHLPNEPLTQQFIQQARDAGLYGLKGHRKVGGIRAGIYNAMPEAGVDALLNFMADFVKKNS